MISTRCILRASVPFAILGALAFYALDGQAALKRLAAPPRRFSFKIDDAMPMHELLPTPQATALKPAPLLNEDLT